MRDLRPISSFLMWRSRTLPPAQIPKSLSSTPAKPIVVRWLARNNNDRDVPRSICPALKNPYPNPPRERGGSFPPVHGGTKGGDYDESFANRHRDWLRASGKLPPPAFSAAGALHGHPPGCNRYSGKHHRLSEARETDTYRIFCAKPASRR